MSLDLQSHVAAAVSADRFSEADALQGELDAATADAAALESAHAFTDKDLGSALQSLSSLSTAQDNAAAAQAEASATTPVSKCQDKSIAQPASAPQLPAPLIEEHAEEPAESGAEATSGGDLGEHTKLQEVAASEAVRPASARALQRPDSGSRQQLAAIGLNRQLTDERTLSGYITDSDSAAEATPTLRGNPAGRGARLPFAGQLQSATSREALSAGMSASVSACLQQRTCWHAQLRWLSCILRILASSFFAAPGPCIGVLYEVVSPSHDSEGVA